ncbi:hypothetical protein HK098_005566 [Nowakowskiella sp. JEL0407]|nr:hypothetical protein HK098_005566 [Nowakowskiella sp. JEL0407]
MKGFGTVAAILALIAMIIHVEASSTNSELAKRGTAADWSSCTYSSDCANKCCQKAADGKYYCYSNKPTHPEWDVCTADQVPSPVGTFPDWSGCTYSGQCKNGCCQKAADGNYYCYTNKPSHPEWDQCTDVQANCPAGFWHPPNASDPRKCCSKNSSYAPGTGCYCDPAVYVWSPTANEYVAIPILENTFKSSRLTFSV